MLFSSASKCEFRATRSSTYFALICLMAAAQVLLLFCFPRLLPLLPLSLFSIVLSYWHWWCYRPKGYFSAEQIAYQQGGKTEVYQWLANSRVAFTCCIIIGIGQDRLKLNVIFADSIEHDIYRRMCFVINFPIESEQP
ncbi:hypothetical protein ACRRS0_15700 [Agarivorans sp. QJM3NY_29]|uniref:hypothetical protein n=1 Tax=unclassified Agarivorans TaxID=2636026 RepID=UPI003D7C94E4